MGKRGEKGNGEDGVRVGRREGYWRFDDGFVE